MKYIELLRRLSNLSPKDLDCEVMVTSLAASNLLTPPAVSVKLGNLESGRPLDLDCLLYDETEPIHTITVTNEQIRSAATEYGYKPTDDECCRIMELIKEDMFSDTLFEHYAENDMLGSKNEIEWGKATEEDLVAAHYTGDAYMAVPSYFYEDNDGERLDVAGGHGYYYKSKYDVNMTVVDVVRDMGRAPEKGAFIGVRIYHDHFENGVAAGSDMEVDIWFDDENGGWNRDELEYL